MVRGVRVVQKLEKARSKGVSRVWQRMEGIKGVALRRLVTARMMLLSRSANRREGTNGPRVATTVARKHCSNFGLHHDISFDKDVCHFLFPR